MLYEGTKNQSLSVSREATFLNELYDVLLLVGVFTFGVALYSNMSIKFAYRLILAYFFVVLVLQCIALGFESSVFFIIIFIVDGLFHGGMLILFFEMTAELAYPVGEALSLGLFLAIYFGCRFVILVTYDSLIDDRMDDEEELEFEKKYIAGFWTVFGIFVLGSLACIVLAWRSKPDLVRTDFDSLDFEADASETSESEDENRTLEVAEYN